jgi:oligopeptide/dipeptide ABC transporter ATP-binding protein
MAYATCSTQKLGSLMQHDKLLSVQNLTLSIQREGKEVELIKDISFDIKANQTLALVGESGSGKSLTAQAILGLFTSTNIHIKSGKIQFLNQDLLQTTRSELKKLRGKEIAFISQNPMNALNPTLTVGFQLIEAILCKEHISKDAARKRAIIALEQVGISDAAIRLNSYPHEFSGGMRQRVLIAMGLINNPKLIIADEPTTALDVTIQAEILDLLQNLQKTFGLALLFITHDLGIVAKMADDVAVIYAGKIVEIGTVYDIFSKPKHPYTQGLLSAIPRYDAPSQLLKAIDGFPARAGSNHGRCAFLMRCPKAMRICAEREPQMMQSGAQQVSCWEVIHKEKEEILHRE